MGREEVQETFSSSIVAGLDMVTTGWNTTSRLAVLEDRPYPSIAQKVMMWTLPVPMVLLNIIVFVVVPRMKTIRPCTGYGMISLGLADFCLGLTHIMRMSYNVYSDYQLRDGHPMCDADGYFQALFASISIVTLAFMNLDRLLAVAFPLKYPRHVSKRRMASVHISIWVLLICYLAPTITGVVGTRSKYYKYAFMCVPDWAGNLWYNIPTLAISNIIPTFVVGACFCGIFYFARTKSKALKGPGGAGGVQVHHGGGAAASKSNDEFQRDLRIFRTLALMTFGFYLAWTPYFVTVAIPEIITGESLNHVTDFFTPWLGASNSFWNPIIYVPTMRPFYTAMMELYDRFAAVCCAKCRCAGCSGVFSRLKNTSNSPSSAGDSGSTPASSSTSKATGSTGVTNSSMEGLASNVV